LGDNRVFVKSKLRNLNLKNVTWLNLPIEAGYENRNLAVQPRLAFWRNRVFSERKIQPG